MGATALLARFGHRPASDSYDRPCGTAAERGRRPAPTIGVHEGHDHGLGPGLGAALSSIGFGAITAFSALLFVAHGWAAWPAFTVFAAVFIVARLFLGHLADRFPAPKVALLTVLVEAVGLALLAVAPSLPAALAGAALTGFGYSLVYPALGVEAVRSVPAQNHGLAMGAYTAFLDVALGFGTPVLGFLAERAGLGSAFIASALAALGTAGIAGHLLKKSPPRERRLPV
jgi:MFS family permease